MYLETRSASPDLLMKRLQSPSLQNKFEQHSAYMLHGALPWKVTEKPPARPYQRRRGTNRSKAIVFLSECCGGIPCCGAPQTFVAEDRTEEQRPARAPMKDR